MANDTTNAIEFEVVTPKGRALRAVVDEVTAPSVDGEFGVLPGHIPLLAALRTGIVSYRKGAETKKCCVGVGFVEVGPNKVAILTDEYVDREHIDVVSVRKDLAEIQGELAKFVSVGRDTCSPEAAALAPLIDKENWLAAQLELYGDPPHAVMRPYEQFGPPDPVADNEIPEDTSSSAS